MNSQTENKSEKNIQILINGRDAEIPEASTINSVLKQIKIDGAKVAIALNEAHLPRNSHNTTLKAGDRLEIVSPMVGG